MGNRLLLLALAAGMSWAASAQQPLTIRSQEAVNSGLKTRTGNGVVNHKNPARAFSVNSLHKAKSSVTARVLRADETENPYGTVVEVMYEDFSKMSNGSFEEPDLNTNINYGMGEYEYPWWNLKPEYTTLPNWGSDHAYPAGGMVYFDPVEYGAHINTPLLNVAGYDGIAVLQFRARTAEGESEGMVVEAAETFNMGPTWNVLGAVPMPAITNEWRTYEVTVQGGGETSLFNIVIPATASPVYIDDVRVYQIDQYVNTPVTLPHSNYNGRSFDANWEAVDGAEYYLLNVYSLDENGQVKDLLTDQKAEGTSYTVEGIVSGETYYYAVRAVKGSHESIETLPVEVFDLEAPVLNKASEVKDSKYTATWSEVPSAERYNYWAYNVRTADADGEFVVTDENFDGVRDADGNLTGLTIEDPSYSVYPELYLADLSQAGWKGSNYMPYTDYICVDGWQYLHGQGDAGLISPELDLSKDNGKVNLSIKLYGELVDMWDADNNQVICQTECAVALFNYDEAKGDYVQDELIYPEGVSAEWKTFNITLTKGTKRSKIGIYAVKAEGNLYMDDLKITQTYKKGESLMEPFFFARWHEGTSIEVEVPSKVVNSPVYHKVNATKARAGSDPNAGAEFKESAYSSLELVADCVTSIGGSMLREEAGVTAAEGVLSIVNPQGEGVTVYAVDGTQVFSDNSGRRNISVSLSGRGVYIVKIGGKAVKIRN